MIHLWRGFHHHELPLLLSSAWKKNELVILLPLHLKELSFLKNLSAEFLQFHGTWSEELKQTAVGQCGKVTRPELSKACLGVFTSGTSTGLNRLIFYSKENVESSLAAIRDLFDAKKIKKIFCYPQPTHTFGLILGYLHSVLNNLELGFSEGAYSSSAHEQWLKFVDENTLSLGAPTHFQDLLRHLKTTKQSAPASYSAIVGGAKVSVYLWDQLQSELHIKSPSVGYGATEASPGVTHLAPGIRPAIDGDIGQALKNVEIELSEEGLEFTGPNVCYLILENNELKTHKKILLRDSIVESLTESGPRFVYLGRTDSMINRGGIKISLDYVESVIADKTKLTCLAISLFDSRLGDDLGMVVDSEDPSIKISLQKIIEDHFGFKIDANSILLQQIPLNPNGKGDRIAATKLLLKQKSWSFPVPVEILKNLLPHKGPAIWIDSILQLDEKFAVGAIKLNQSRPYFSRNEESVSLRETACIEWVAQTYGYSTALGDILNIREAKISSRTYIAEVKSAEFHFRKYQRPFVDGDEIQIKVHCTHDFGHLKVVDGQVYHHSNLLALISVKLYCG